MLVCLVLRSFECKHGETLFTVMTPGGSVRHLISLRRVMCHVTVSSAGDSRRTAAMWKGLDHKGTGVSTSTLSKINHLNAANTIFYCLIIT